MKVRRRIVPLGVIMLALAVCLHATDEQTSDGGPTTSTEEDTAQTEPVLKMTEHEVIREASELMRSGDREGALALIEQSSVESTSAALEFVKGNIQYQSGNLESAIESYELSNELDSQFMRAYRILGQLYAGTDRNEKARVKLSRAIKLGARDGRTYGLMGSVYLKLDEPGVAEQYFREAAQRGASKETWEGPLKKTRELQGKTDSESDGPTARLREEDEVDAPPVLTEYEEPEYPKELLRKQIRGRTVLGIILDEKGEFITVYTIESDHPAFSREALHSILNSEFDPAELEGEPVKIAFEMTIPFEPPNAEPTGN